MAQIRPAHLIFLSLSASFFSALCGVAIFFPDLRQWLAGYAPALTLTLIMEGAVAYIMGYRTRDELGAALLCSLMTHPALYLTVTSLFLLFGDNFTRGWDFFIAIMEMLVIVSEYAILRCLLPHKGRENARLAAAMNLLSYFGGLLIFKAFSAV